MKHTILLTLITLVSMNVVRAQDSKDGRLKQTCALTLNQAPVIRGFRLTAPFEELTARFPGIINTRGSSAPSGFGGRPQVKGFGDFEIFFIDGRLRPNGGDVDQLGDGSTIYVSRYRFSDFKDVHGARLSYFDGRLSLFKVTYDWSISQGQWSSTDEFVSIVSETLGLPNHWQRKLDNPSNTERVLVCDGFSITADVGRLGTTPALTLEDLTTETRRKEKETQELRSAEERRKTFKP